MSGSIIGLVQTKDWSVDISGDDPYSGAERVYTVVTYGDVDWRQAFLELARREYNMPKLAFAEGAAP